ncbi:MAG: LicD family protein [Bacillus sp. (in: Bacteria)]|nr:LicD family protein [Bacillus sp. (in: firmicutes)]MCM1425856.1 LicD family protein [Eubacterium sp.]
MKFDESFLKEEVRWDFKVDRKRKKVWSVAINLLEQLDIVCKKYDIPYYVYYGTLLGAVRHKGFIPWDDDIDVVMFRQDYEKFQEIAPKEFKAPYFFQNSYNDQMLWFFSKIRDSRTTAIEFSVKNFNQGMFIDIFPLDDVPDGVHEEFSTVLEVQRDIKRTIYNPKQLLLDYEQGKQFTLDIDILLDLIKMDRSQRLKEFETLSLSYAGQSENVNYILDELSGEGGKSVKREWFQETVYLPFEHIKVPAPAEYDKILTQCYGDYMTPVKGGTGHENIILDPDMPYDVFFDKYLEER